MQRTSGKKYWKVFNISRIEESWDGFKWQIRDKWRHDSMVLTKREYSILKFLNSVANKDKVFVEVGVHVGYYSIRMTKLYKKVYAIEPNPYSIDGLKENMKLNNITNIKILPVACGEIEMESSLLMREGSSTFIYGKTTEDTIKVQIKKLDDLIESVDVMKIDVEGYEVPVIKGGLNLINRYKPVIVIEHHDLGDYYEVAGSFNIIQNLLNGYKAFNLDGVRYTWIDKQEVANLPEESLKILIVYHWFNKAIKNITSGLAWYHGLPHTWWYGMGIIDFIEVLQEHIKEPEWLEFI